MLSSSAFKYNYKIAQITFYQDRDEKFAKKILRIVTNGREPPLPPLS
jgi:hypothetical protein